MRTFNAGVAQIAIWDDHEVRDNWYEARDLSADDRYQVKSMALLASRARQAFLEFNPIGRHADDAERIHRTIGYGPLLEIFALDLRSYRGANSGNRQTSLLAGVSAFRRRHSSRPSRPASPRSRADVEGHRQRFADRADRRRRRGPVRGLRQRRCRATSRARARDRRPAAIHPRPPHPQRRLDHRRRALLRRAPLPSVAGTVHRVRSVLGIRRRPASRRHVRAEHARSRRSGPRRSSTACRRG